MIRIKRLLSMLATVALVSCGGGSGDTAPYGGDAGSGGGDGGGGGGGGTVAVANLTLNLSAASVNNSGSETVVATVTATNANNQTMADAPIVLSVNSNATIAVAGSTTDADGKLAGTVTIGDDRTNRTITVTAVANGGALTRTKTFQVVGANLTGTPLPAVVPVSGSAVVKYRLIDANSNPMPDVPITITGPGGVETRAVTGSLGDYDYTYTAPAAAGDLTIRASAGGDSLDLTVLVQAAGGGSIPPVDPVANAVLSSSVSANPSVVAVNTTGTSNQSQLRVLFQSNQNAPVKNIRVRFDLNGDPNSIGGSFTTGTTMVYSDVNGIATSSYVAGSRASPTDGVSIRACWDYNDFAVGTCPNQATTTLTVIADAVSVSIGTNNLIDVGASRLTYVKRYSVLVVDSSGLAKPDVTVSASLDLLQYLKGEWVPSGTIWVKIERAFCDNEDVNRNNILEAWGAANEDANGTLTLEPRKADVAVSIEGSNKTDSSGIVVVRLEYPQSLGSWVKFNLQVSASGVSGTEGRDNFISVLPVRALDISDVKVSPPFQFSPYGLLASPTTVVTSPQGKTGVLCTDPN